MIFPRACSCPRCDGDACIECWCAGDMVRCRRLVSTTTERWIAAVCNGGVGAFTTTDVSRTTGVSPPPFVFQCCRKPRTTVTPGIIDLLYTRPAWLFALRKGGGTSRVPEVVGCRISVVVWFRVPISRPQPLAAAAAAAVFSANICRLWGTRSWAWPCLLRLSSTGEGTRVTSMFSSTRYHYQLQSTSSQCTCVWERASV